MNDAVALVRVSARMATGRPDALIVVFEIRDGSGGLLRDAVQSTALSPVVRVGTVRYGISDLIVRVGCSLKRGFYAKAPDSGAFAHQLHHAISRSSW